MAPQAFTAPHFGLTVPAIEDAIQWYTTTLGYRLLTGPLEILEDGSPLGLSVQQIYGEGFKRFRFAHLATADDVGLELFQFDNPATTRPDENFPYWSAGFNHLGLTAPDIGATAEKIVNAGGRARTSVITVDPEKGYKIVYLEDPWGTVLELCSHPYVQMWEQTTAAQPEC